jgi:hypothetical protein
MSNQEKMSLKTFWEAAEQRLAACSAEELRTILRAMAWETPPLERQTFLDKLERSEAATLAARQAVEQEDLLVDIDDLARELETAMEEADAWDDRVHWDEYYDEEDSLGPYEEFVEPLAELFDRAESTFDNGHLPLARTAYQSLFEVLNTEDEYGRGVQASDLTSLDAGEAVARYLRAVYETEPAGQRPQTLLAQMQQVRSWLMRSRPMLNDLIQISPRPLPDRERFWADWISFLQTQSGPDADGWLREAVRLSQGTRGLEDLARAEGQARPRAYLDWFTALEQEGKYQEVLAAAREALETLAAGLPIRAAVADHLCTAAARLDETEALHAGRWEAFLAKPTLPRLLDLWDVGIAGEGRRELMQQAAQHVCDYLAHSRNRFATMWSGKENVESPAWIGPEVLAHSYLLAGDFNAAHQLAAGQKVLGWSSRSSVQGWVVAFLLALLSGETPATLPPNLAAIWRSGLENSTGYRFGDDAPLRQRLEEAYTERLSGASLSPGRQNRFLAWCLKVSEQRIDAIVSNQYRKSYGKAAVLTGACAETLRALGDQEAATSFVSEIRNRFPRHRAFQSKLKAAIT